MRKQVKKSKGIFKESLENISRNLFKDHSEIITELIGNSSGIYALYDENELYYVGRASALKRRVNQHLKDRHDSQWTHFSLFLIKRTDYIGDLESLLIRIAEPVGNRVKPKGRDSKQMVKKLKALLKKKHKEEIEQLIPGRKALPNKKPRPKKNFLKGLVEKRSPVYRTYKGKEYKAIITPAGSIVFRGKKYSSPTAAAKVIAKGKPINGWYFWRIKNSAGDWVRLADY